MKPHMHHQFPYIKLASLFQVIQKMLDLNTTVIYLYVIYPINFCNSLYNIFFTCILFKQE